MSNKKPPKGMIDLAEALANQETQEPSPQLLRFDADGNLIAAPDYYRDPAAQR